MNLLTCSSTSFVEKLAKTDPLVPFDFMRSGRDKRTSTVFCFASADLTIFPPEERHRIYAALGVQVTAYKDKRIEIVIGDPTADYFRPDEDEPRQLVERIIYNTERIREREEQQA